MATVSQPEKTLTVMGIREFSFKDKNSGQLRTAAVLSISEKYGEKEGLGYKVYSVTIFDAHAADFHLGDAVCLRYSIRSDNTAQCVGVIY